MIRMEQEEELQERQEKEIMEQKKLRLYAVERDREEKG